MTLSFKDYITEKVQDGWDGNEPEQLNESSLSRIWSKTQDNECATISAFRGENTKAENKKLTFDLRTALHKLGYSVTEIYGGYVENTDDGKTLEVKEISFFVQNKNNDANFKTQIAKLGKHFSQDSVLIIPKGGKGAYLLFTRGSGMGQKQVVGDESFGKITDLYFSKIGGRGFEFKAVKAINENTDPDTIHGKWGYDLRGTAVLKESETVDIEGWDV